MPLFVSIITPHVQSTRPAHYLQEAYASLIKQTYPHWTWHIAGNQALPQNIQNDPRVTHTFTPTKGNAAVNRNYALATTRNDTLLTCLDDDDRLPPNSLQIRVDAYNATPLTAWVVGDGEDWKNGSLTKCNMPMTAQAAQHQPGDLHEIWGDGSGVPFLPTGVLTETQLVKHAGGWNESIPQLEDFWLFVPLMNWHYGTCIPESVYHYRKHSLQTMESEGFWDREPGIRADFTSHFQTTLA